MTDSSTLSWTALLVLGAFHGINPAMGWLFAVALGMQERRARAVWVALFPLGIGHALAIGVTVLLAFLSSRIVATATLRTAVALALVVFGIAKLLRQRHPRWRGLRVGIVGLTYWSFLVAFAHGAGLMVLPFVLHAASPADSSHVHHLTAGSDVVTSLLAAAVHGVGYLVTTATVAWIVYSKLGLALLRTAWVNLDLIWAAAAIATGLLTLLT
jgi:hypothetical protein